MAALAASACCADVGGGGIAASAWRGNGIGGWGKDLLVPKIRVSRRCSGSRAVERVGRPCAVRMEESLTSGTKGAKKKVARLSVEKIRTVPLPTFVDASGNSQHLRAFLREPEGRQCMLNTKALRKFEDLGDGAFKCYLPMMEFLGFEVAPVLELLVDAGEENCQVHMVSCKFEGSDIIRGQNERFAASMRNHLSWSSGQEQGEEENLHVRVEVDVSLEVHTLPFTVLPISAVESPGTMILQALVDRLIPVFVESLLVDYQTWAEAQKATGDADGSPTDELLGAREESHR